MSYRVLTSTEIAGFKSRHPMTFLDLMNKQSVYIKDDVLGGYVLVFLKADGNIQYTLSETNPAKNDPERISIFGEFLNALVDNTKDLMNKSGEFLKIGSISLSAIAIIAIVILIFVYYPKQR